MAKKKAVKKKAAAPADKRKTQAAREAARNKGEQEQFFWVYDDLAKVTGKERGAIYQAVTRGAFDPNNFVSVLYYLARHANLETKQNMLKFMLEAGNNANPGMKKKKK